MKPGKENKVENKKRAETSINPFILIEDQKQYYESQPKCVDPSLATASVRKTAFEFFAKDDIDPIISEVCRIYASLIRRLSFKNLISFYAFFEQYFTEAMKLIKVSIGMMFTKT